MTPANWLSPARAKCSHETETETEAVVDVNMWRCEDRWRWGYLWGDFRGGKNIHKTKIKNEISFLAKDLRFRFNFDSFLFIFGKHKILAFNFAFSFTIFLIYVFCILLFFFKF